jgi:NADPH:quinone reductase
MVHAIRVHAFGGPEVLQFDDIELEAPAEGQVRIRQHAVGLNFIDVYHREGRYPNPLPFTPGSEASGEVVEVGAGVTEFKPGDRVAYGTALGAYAEERLVAAEKLVKLPDEISYETAAVMMLKGMTAQYLVKQTYPVEPGDTILVHAAAGGMGQILCQWGKALGGKVIGTVGSAEKAEIARAKGADHVINYREEDFAARVREITGGKLVDVVYDGVGKATFPASLDCIRPRGLFASFGSSSGQIDAFNIMLLAQKGSLFATRPTLFSYASDRASLIEMASDVMDALKTGKITLDIGSRFPLKDAAAAHKALEARETTGATVLLV